MSISNCCLDFGTAVEPVCLVIFKAADWEYSTLPVFATCEWQLFVPLIFSLTFAIYDTRWQYVEHWRFHFFYINTLTLRKLMEWPRVYIIKYQISERKYQIIYIYWIDVLLRVNYLIANKFEQEIEYLIFLNHCCICQFHTQQEQI